MTKRREIRRPVNYGSYDSYGTAAPKYPNYNNYPNPYSYPNYNNDYLYYPKEGKRSEKLKQQKIIHKKATKEKRTYFFKIYLTIIIIFAFAVLTLLENAVKVEYKSELSSMKKELKEVQENNIYLEKEIAKSIDLEKIETLAIARLGMSKPASHQIEYISVPKQSYTVQYENDYSEEKSNISLGSITEFTKNFLRIE